MNPFDMRCAEAVWNRVQGTTQEAPAEQGELPALIACARVACAAAQQLARQLCGADAAAMAAMARQLRGQVKTLLALHYVKTGEVYCAPPPAAPWSCGVADGLRTQYGRLQQLAAGYQAAGADTVPALSCLVDEATEQSCRVLKLLERHL